MINLSVLLCLAAGVFGVFALVKWFCIFKSNVYTNANNVFPIFVGTLAWFSAALTFYQTATFNSPVNFERSVMVVVWALLIYRLKVIRDKSNNLEKRNIILNKKLRNK